jgi:hypothetical protein
MKGGPEIWRNSSSSLYKPILWFSNLHLLSLIRTSAKLIKIVFIPLSCQSSSED